MAEVTVTLSDAQVAQVLRETTDGNHLSALFAVGGDQQALRTAIGALRGDRRYATSAVLAALLLAAFPVGGEARELTEVAGELDLAIGTAHRYARTWVAVGLLEQDPRTRRYRRPACA